MRTQEDLSARLGDVVNELRSSTGSSATSGIWALETVIDGLAEAVWVRADHLMGVAELAKLFYGTSDTNKAIGRTSISGWAANPNAGFPLPVTKLLASPVWDVADVVNWWLDYTPIKGAKGGSLSADDVKRYTGRELT